MKRLLVLVFVCSVVFVGCDDGSKGKEIEKFNDVSLVKKQSNLVANSDEFTNDKIKLAIDFLNLYLQGDSIWNSLPEQEPLSEEETKYLNEIEASGDPNFDKVNFLKASNLASKNFITEMENFNDFGYDPIIDGQDSPSSFNLVYFNLQSGYIVFQGVDWKDFKITMRVVVENEKLKIDGSGVINIPFNKQKGKLLSD